MKNNPKLAVFITVSISLLMFRTGVFASDLETLASPVINNPNSLKAQVEQLCARAEAQADHRNYSAAEASCEKALQLAQTQGEMHPLVAQGLRAKANILVDEQKLADAEIFADKALAIDKNFQDNNVLAKDYLKLAYIYISGLRLAPAYRAAEFTIELEQKETAKKNTNAGEALLYLALVDKMCGQPDKAIEKLHRAVAIANDFPNTEFEIDALRMHAFLLEESGKYDQALPIHQQALAKAEIKYGANSASAEKCLMYLAECYTNLKKFQDAYNVDKKRLALVKQIYGSHSDELGNLYSKMGDLEESLNPKYDQNNPSPYKLKAILFYQQGKVTPRAKKEEAILAGQFALAERSGELTKSGADPIQKTLSSIDKVIEKDEQKYGKLSPMLTKSLNILGQLYMATSDYDNAKNCFKREIDIYNDAIGSFIPQNEPSPLVPCVLTDYEKGRIQAQKEYEKAMAATSKMKTNQANN